MEKNFIGLSELQERVFTLLAEGNEPRQIAKILGYTQDYIYKIMATTRTILDARNTIHAVALLVADLVEHHNW